MATSLTLTVGALTRTLTAPDDAKAVEVLTRFARVRHVPDALPIEQRIDGVLAELAGWMVQEARREYVNALRAEQEAEAEHNVGW